MMRWLRYLPGFGTKSTFDQEELLSQRRNILFARFAITVLVIIAIHTVQDVFRGLWVASLIDGSILLIVLLSYFLNEWGKHSAGKILMIVFANFALLLYCAVVPKANGVFLFYFPLLAVSSVTFHPDRRKTRYGLIGLCLSGILVLAFNDFKPFGDISIPAETEQNSFIINILSSAFLVIVCIEFMSKTNAESEARLITLAAEIQSKNNDLEKTNVELDRFLYSTSHDLRAPISSIRGLIMIAQKEAKETDIQKYLSMMHERTEKLDQFIHEIINYSRNARTDLATDLVNIKKLIEDITEGFAFFEGSERIKIELDVNEDRLILTDSVRLKIILNNLISNSYKYQDESKSQPFIRITAKYGKNHLIIAIKDNGIGVEQEYQDKIFDMFYRGTDKSKGSGLGLYIVKEIITRMSGKINIHSVPGIGTEFTITLPVSYQTQERKHEQLSLAQRVAV